MKAYLKFLTMIIVSTTIMYGLMFFNIFQFSDYFFSQTMFWMALLMGATMAIVMLLFMWPMYKNKRVNQLILLGSALIFAGSLYLVRSQATVNDTAWLQGMIPHHSMAILTSERAQLSDPEVKALAEQIAKTQRQEIQQMEQLLNKVAK
ncbi:DUF305 domain-containing protein [Loigolactobacillus zhaoyuanensis]|uniref:DUF305 domain-containing protein n=1 Tax=Loigolactobacillus zhaoyuanensis TaxID=2486017 RepID=A0ABW8UCF6_9LACO|nr:DUF305 domain-containing protein [Loigolactobacillus zhaoyuanensis]